MTPVRIDAGTTPLELAGIVATMLRIAGIEAVLSGGAAVAAYTNDRYLTRDIDFVTSVGLDEIGRALGPGGFVRLRRQRHFEHPDSDLLVEFPPGPPAVGSRLLFSWGELPTAYGPVQILTPTQMVMDRLAAWWHWSDPQSFAQAVWIAERHPIDLESLDEWVADEGIDSERYARFRSKATVRGAAGGT